MADYLKIQEMDIAIREHPTAADLLKNGEHETPLTWTDAVTGEVCKCRPDVIRDGLIVDYKTTTDCSPGAFERSCRAYGYKLQAAMYQEGVFYNRFERCEFIFVAQEKAEPYHVRVYRCDPGFIEDGMEIFRDLIGRLHNCKTSGKWPGYEDEVLYGD